jgi:flotillin
MIGLILGAVGVGVTVICSFAWYRIVPPSEAHLVVTPYKKMVVSSDDKISTDKKKAYFAIPNFIPFFGRNIRRMDVTIKELVVGQETYEKDQARYNVVSSLKYRIQDVQSAAETFTSDQELKEMLTEVVKSSVRAVTIKYDVVNTRSKKSEIQEQIRVEMDDDLKKWGLQLMNFQLIDFRDTEDSNIISDISKRREVEIQSRTRQENAEKKKLARVKEAEAEEVAKQREIEKDKVIGEQEQLKTQKIAEMQKTAEEKRFAVVQVQTIKQAEIDKEKAIVQANQAREQEEILKQKKKLEGEGDRLKQEEQAKGVAAPIREKGLAEAEAKEKLQSALNKFGDDAIRALVAEKIVEKDKDVGVATARALEKADLKVFSGGEGDRQGFDLGKIISSASVADGDAANAILNKLGRPNDLGFTALGLKSVVDSKKVVEEEVEVKKD